MAPLNEKQPSGSSNMLEISVHDCTGQRGASSEPLSVKLGQLSAEQFKLQSLATAGNGIARKSTFALEADGKYAASGTVPLTLSTPTLTTLLVQVKPKTSFLKAIFGCLWRRESKETKWKKIDIVANDNQIWALQSVPSSKSSKIEVLVFATVDPVSWMAQLPDSALLSSLCVPGTHESLARYGYPISTCQNESATVAVQLAAGIRFLDVRLVAKGEGDASKQRCLAYHGITDERIDLGEVLQQCWAFLDGAGKKEVIIMSIKPEADAAALQACFEQVYLSPTRSRWFLDPKVPTLGQARGKIVLMSRYGSSNDQPGGIHPTNWPNSLKDTFSYTLPSKQVVETQDWYDIGSLAALGDKFSLMQKLLTSSGSNPSVLSINFANGSSFPFALPPPVAMGSLGYEGMNQRIRDYVANVVLASNTSSSAAPPRGKQPFQGALKPLMCYFNLDYYEMTTDLVPLLIQANFQ